MDVSQLIHSTQASAISPDGTHIATLNNSQLEIRRISTLHIVRSINVTTNHQSKFLCIRWSPVAKGFGASDRFLLSDEDITRVWDLQDENWCATIDNGTGGMGKIANVEFGSDDSEVLVFSSYGSKVTAWSLWTGKSTDIKDPKFARRGYGRSATGRNGVFAILTRPAAQDIVSLHVPGSYALIRSFTPQTSDAQGLRWSPDGKWLAIWDTPSAGYKVMIYTADGNLFRTFSGDYFDDDLKGLGIKSIEWSPNGDFLILAGFEKTLTMLGTKTFSPAVHLSHPTTVRPTRTQIWQECFTANERSYTRVMQPISPPSAPPCTDKTVLPVGISLLAFSADGSYLATKDDSMPTAVWVWDLAQLTCCAVMLQHSVVKKVHWHPTDPNSLLIQCIQGESVLYSWNALEAGPRVLNMPSIALSGKAEAQWIPKASSRKPVIVFGDHKRFALAYPEGKDAIASPYLEAQAQIDPQSDTDSVYEALTGKQDKSDKLPDGQTPFVPPEDADTKQVYPEDTFDYRKGVHVY